MLLCTSLPCCTGQLLPISALVPLCPSGHIVPRALLGHAPHCQDELLSPSRAPSPPAWQQTVPRHHCCARKDDFSYLRYDPSRSQPQLLLTPQRPCASPVVGGCNQQRQTHRLKTLDHGHLLPTGCFYLHIPNFLTDEDSLASTRVGSSVLQRGAEVGDHRE